MASESIRLVPGDGFRPVLYDMVPNGAEAGKRC